MMYHVDMEGRQLFEKINFSEERVDLIENPLLGPLLRRRTQLMQDELMCRKANKIAIYYLNLHKRYDLDVSATYSQPPRTTCSTGRSRAWTGSVLPTTSLW
jgi:hypothetical protein